MAKVYTVSAANSLIKETLATQPSLQRIQIEGEISNFKRYDSGHCYFTLKDEKSTIKAVMFRGRAALLRFKPENGTMVLASGRIEVYERDGVYQLYVDNLFPGGSGNLALACELLKNKLAAEGLFAAEKKRPIPFFPQTVGIITSSAGAVLHDIITVAGKRNAAVKLIFFPVRVQGKEAPGEIDHAIKSMNKMALADVLIVGRGGGSLEELWAFNDERVVRSVAASAIPVVSAVGHETDFTLCDFAADLRAATPSQAAELCVPDRQALLDTVAALRKRMEQLLRAKADNLALRLKHCLASPVFRRPETLYTASMQQLDKLDERLRRAEENLVGAKEKRLSSLTAKLDVLSPLAVLARGYSVTADREGRLVKSISQLRNGDVIKTRLADGMLYACVESLRKEE